ncbi:serine hydrolase domain-containing protein [Pseudoalteromonas denitrificans]|uniref:CubicO group peptidase, beta-lactamase class C family n=1 Tax=Pseudoalteromonas denitrificans DSM 6059 TaxID=1123010 RepID=A0A1I1DX82_9GAMM|nr:serine hydrolase domain-containing protein [Pseudoalteromonas denitrificans]SFB79511.1 CubicO group peptidase, beta-lactamase class C family [Pseudoalteromonas denitrificans DSM 6059]
MRQKKSKSILKKSISTLSWLAFSSTVFASGQPDISVISQVSLEVEQDASTIPAVAAAVVTNSEILWQGVANCDPLFNTSGMTCPTSTMLVNDQVRIGSETKTFTGTVILQMVQEGKISLNDTLEFWLPDFGVPNANQVTIKHLLQMTSGIPDYLVAPALDGVADRTVLDQWAIEHGLTSATAKQLIAQTNNMDRTSGMSYSNSNFVLLGEIARKISCMDQPECTLTIGEVITSRIMMTMGLNDTIFPTNTEFNRPFADGYVTVVDGGPITGSSSLTPSINNTYETYFTHVSPDVPNSAGAIISNIPDQIQWIRQLASNKNGLLTPEIQAQRLHDTVPGSVGGLPANYGLAIYDFESALNGSVMVGHSGSIFGYTSSIFHSPLLDVYYVIDVTQTPVINDESAVNYLWNLDRQISLAFFADGTCSDDVDASGLQCTGANVRTTSLNISMPNFAITPSGKTTGGYDFNQCTTNAMGAQTCTPVTHNVPSLASYGHDLSSIILDTVNFTLETDALLEMHGRDSTAILIDSASTLLINGTILTEGNGSTAIKGSEGDDTITISSSAKINGPIDLAGGNNTIIFELGAKITGKLYANSQDTITLFHNENALTIKILDTDGDGKTDMQVTDAQGIATTYQSSGETEFSQDGVVLISASSLIIPADVNADNIVDFIAYLDNETQMMALLTTHTASPGPTPVPVIPVKKNASGSLNIFWLIGLLFIARTRRLIKS